jgi:signal transduction histidine kinase
MSAARSGRFPFFGMFGQTALLISAALLVAQATGFFLLVSERDRWRFLDAVQPALEKFATAARDIAAAPPEKRVEAAFRASRFDQPVMLFPNSEIAFLHLKRQTDLEDKLKDALDRAHVRVIAIAASSVGFADSPQGHDLPRGPFPMLPPNPFGAGVGPNGPLTPPDGRRIPFGPEWNRSPLANLPPFRRPPDENRQEIYLSARLPNGAWLNSHVFSIRPPAYFLSRLIAAELVLFAVVLAASLFLAARLARPLARLARASERIGPNEAVEPVPVKGPRDVRAAILSFNAMASRVTDLLREKDRMLGAIGHDLRTPLASLRIRVESIEPAVERERIVETLDEMTKMIDDILNLARLGRQSEPFVLVDLTALADSVVEAFRELGKDVTFLDSPRAVLKLQPALVKRLVRNLIENAVKFGVRARVSVGVRDNMISLLVLDDGPGIPPESLEAVLEPFTRVETSRSRETGGIGLGLSIAQAIARSQSARLSLTNRLDGGLEAKVTWRAS